jgi:hypothetical protein
VSDVRIADGTDGEQDFLLLSALPVKYRTMLSGSWPARLADSIRTRRSPPEQGSSLTRRAVITAAHSMAAIRVVPSLMLVPVVMKRLVKSSRRRNVPSAVSRATPASSG